MQTQVDASHRDMGTICQAQYQLGLGMRQVHSSLRAVEDKVGQANDQLAYVYEQSGQSWSVSHHNQQILFQDMPMRRQER